jgi:hypothetical protein
MKKPVLSLETVKEAAMSGRRSALYRWMLENFDQFSRTVDEAGRPNWQALARTFGEAGLRDRLGKVPSAEGTRQTWFLVRQAVTKTPKLAGRPAAMVPGPSRPVTASGERQPAPLQSSPLPSAAPSSVGVIDPIAPPPVRRRMRFQSARALAPGEAPKDDGSKLPRPLHPNLKIED